MKRLQWRKHPIFYKSYEARSAFGRFAIYCIIGPQYQVLLEIPRGPIHLIGTFDDMQKASDAANDFLLTFSTETNSINPQMAFDLRA